MTRLDARLLKLEIGRRPPAPAHDMSLLTEDELRTLSGLTFHEDGSVDLSSLSSAELDELERIVLKLESVAAVDEGSLTRARI